MPGAGRSRPAAATRASRPSRRQPARRWRRPAGGPAPLTPLGRYCPIAISKHGFDLFVAAGATYEREPDPDEIARVEWMPFAEVRRMALAGEIVDGLSLTALLWAMAAGHF